MFHGVPERIYVYLRLLIFLFLARLMIMVETALLAMTGMNVFVCNVFIYYTIFEIQDISAISKILLVGTDTRRGEIQREMV